MESKDFWVGQSARTDSQSALARNEMECVFAQLSCSSGKLARKAGGFLSSLPALKHYSWLTFCASPAKAHETEGSKLLPDRWTDRQSHREDGQAPTAAFCPTWGAYTRASTMRLCDHWPQIQAKLKSQWAADRQKLKCEGPEESIYKANGLSYTGAPCASEAWGSWVWAYVK